MAEIDRSLWHSILRKCHRNAAKGRGVRLTPDEVEMMAVMFEEGVDLFDGEAEPRDALSTSGTEGNEDPMNLRGSCEDPRLVGAGYVVCGSDADRQWHWQAPGGPWNDGYKSENAAVNAALRDLAATTKSKGQADE
ncbi:MAG TPA: hypothetical protein VGN93_31155 [Shinella sp.]|jgi:hypothetical protein|uniref:hypothetical protein n=1 Tax=Shinella sp. TaxID=1870904 RepID=UPI002E12CA3E|nr:hypothetical protein [Shinella sp.]